MQLAFVRDGGFSGPYHMVEKGQESGAALCGGRPAFGWVAVPPGLRAELCLTCVKAAMGLVESLSYTPPKTPYTPQNTTVEDLLAMIERRVLTISPTLENACNCTLCRPRTETLRTVVEDYEDMHADIMAVLARENALAEELAEIKKKPSGRLFDRIDAIAAGLRQAAEESATWLRENGYPYDRGNRAGETTVQEGDEWATYTLAPQPEESMAEPEESIQADLVALARQAIAERIDEIRTGPEYRIERGLAKGELSMAAQDKITVLKDALAALRQARSAFQG